MWAGTGIVQNQSCHTAGLEDNLDHVCWAQEKSLKSAGAVRDGSLEGRMLSLGFDGCIGVLGFSKGGNSYWEWKLYMQQLQAETEDPVSWEC